MIIGVCLKQVPATDTRIRINPSASGILTDDVKFEINPYDEYALEEALRLKQGGKATEVVTFTVGGADADARIRDALARGADRAVRVDDPALEGSDSLGIARVLAAALAGEGVGLVLAGRQAVDGDSSTVPSMIAELMGAAQVSWVDKFDVEGGAFTAQRAAGGGMREVVSGALPAVVSCDKGLNTPRYATLPGILKAKAKKIAVKSVADLGLSPDSVGSAAALVTFTNMGPPPERPAGRILTGDHASAVSELVRLLRDEAKVL